jgi:high-affinity iron transporter
MKATLQTALALLLLIASIAAPCGARADSTEPNAQTVLHLLDYVAVEYPQFVKDGKVINADEYAEQVEFAGQIERAIRALPTSPQREEYAKAAAGLLASIKAKADAGEVSGKAQQLQRDLIAAYNIEVAPKHAPDMRTAGAAYAENCAVCHGVNGDGKPTSPNASGSRHAACTRCTTPSHSAWKAPRWRPSRSSAPSSAGS